MKAKIRSILLNLALLGIVVAVAIPVGRYLPQLYEQVRSHSRQGDFAAHVSGMPHRFTLYGTSTCSHCKSAREYLNKSGIAFNNLVLDQSSDAEAGFQKLGEAAVPVLVAERELVTGFHPEEYDALVKRHAAK